MTQTTFKFMASPNANGVTVFHPLHHSLIEQDSVAKRHLYERQSSPFVGSKNYRRRGISRRRMTEFLVRYFPLSRQVSRRNHRNGERSRAHGVERNGLDAEFFGYLGEPMGSVKEDKVGFWFEARKDLFDLWEGEVHGGGEQRGEVEGYFRAGLGVRREAGGGRDGDEVESDEVGMAVEVLEVVLSFLRQEVGDTVAFSGEVVCEVEVRSHVTDGEPWEHDDVEVGAGHSRPRYRWCSSMTMYSFLFACFRYTTSSYI